MKIFIDECLDFALNFENRPKTKNFFELLNEVFLKTDMYLDMQKIKSIP